MEAKKEEKFVETKTSPPPSWVQQGYESYWLYSESHPYRLFQHITLRGVFMGANFGFLGGGAYALLRKRGKVPLLPYVGKITARGAIGGGLLLGAVAAHRWATLDSDGLTDRAYRISYNWGQTKWDYIACTSGLLGGVLLKAPVGGIISGAAVGIALGNFIYIASLKI